MKKKSTAGVTLIEILLAVTVLAIVIGPIMGMFMAATNLNATASRQTIASLSAQMRMEELVGQSANSLSETLTDASGKLTSEQTDSNGLVVKTVIELAYQGSPALAKATITVHEATGSVALFTLENILKVN